jgi:predicted PurR-regulated permease PerM
MSEPNPQTPDSDEPHPSGESASVAWHTFERYPYLLAKYALFAVAVLGVYALFHSVQAVLFPVLASLLIAYLLDPVVDKFEERGWSRTRAIFLLLAMGFGVMGLFLVFLVPSLIQKIGGLFEALPTAFDALQTDLLPWIQETTGYQVPETASAAIAEYGATLQAQLPTVARGLSSAAGGLVKQVGVVASSLINAVMIPIFTFYFLRDFDTLGSYLPSANREFYLSRFRKVDTVVGAWFRGQVEVALILAVMYAIGLGIVFGWAGVGIGIGIAIGVLAGLLNIIPYFGFAVGFVLSMLMVLLEWSGVGPVVGVLVVFAIVQGLEGWAITPRIVGDKVGLSPVVVIISLLLGQELLGLVGVLLALPIAGALNVLMPDVIAVYKSSSWYTGTVAPEGKRKSIIEVAMQAEQGGGQEPDIRS